MSAKEKQRSSRVDVPGKLIATAAKDKLLPLGCQRVGRSRTWISDQRFWLIVVEFQPSNWEKGTYLNVGAMWLWRPFKGLAFDVGYRIANFVPFLGAEHFSSAAADLATQAADEVLRLQREFGSLCAIYRYLVDHTPETSRDIFHAAIAAGLVGEIDTARHLFQQFAKVPVRAARWQTELLERNSKLAAQIDQPFHFRSSVLDAIQECRRLNGLPEDLNCLDSLLP
jgi:hypothetical protein